MADREKSEDQTREPSSNVLESAISVLQIRQLAGQEIHRTNEALERRTRELAQALAITRATLESTADAIVVTDEKDKITNFNKKFVEMWKIPEELMERDMLRELREFASHNIADPVQFFARIEEIAAAGRESYDQLELRDGRTIERHSKVLTVEGQHAGRVWSFRDLTERHLAATTSRRLAAIVASSDDAIIGKDLHSIITSWNFGAERIFGYTAEEMIGTSIIRLIPPDRQEEEQKILSGLRRGERFVISKPFTSQRTGGNSTSPSRCLRSRIPTAVSLARPRWRETSPSERRRNGPLKRPWRKPRRCVRRPSEQTS